MPCNVPATITRLFSKPGIANVKAFTRKGVAIGGAEVDFIYFITRTVNEVVWEMYRWCEADSKGPAELIYAGVRPDDKWMSTAKFIVE